MSLPLSVIITNENPEFIKVDTNFDEKLKVYRINVKAKKGNKGVQNK